MDMKCREQPERWDDSGRDTKGVLLNGTFISGTLSKNLSTLPGIFINPDQESSLL